MTTLTDADLEARLRATYRTVTATTVAAPRSLPRPEPRPVRSLRYAVVALAVVLLAGLVVVPRLRDSASGARPSGRHAVVLPPTGFRFERVRPYDSTGGLGPATGDWLQYARGRTDRFDVFTLWGPMPSLDGYAETDPVLGRPAFLSADGTMLMWQHSPDITVVVQLLTTGTTASSLPVASLDELRAAAVNVTLVSDGDWERLQTRQGFARIGTDSGTIEGPDDVTLRRVLMGTLRGGLVECIRPEVGDIDSTITICGRNEDAGAHVELIPIDDDRQLMWVSGPSIASVTLDGIATDVQAVVDPDTDVTYRFAVVRADPTAAHVATAFDAAGTLVLTRRIQVTP